jgi:hypothetical protein
MDKVRLGGRVTGEVAKLATTKLRALGFPYGLDRADVSGFWAALAEGRILVISEADLKKLSEKACDKSGNQLY